MCADHRVPHKRIRPGCNARAPHCNTRAPVATRVPRVAFERHGGVCRRTCPSVSLSMARSSVRSAGNSFAFRPSARQTCNAINRRQRQSHALRWSSSRRVHQCVHPRMVKATSRPRAGVCVWLRVLAYVPVQLCVSAGEQASERAHVLARACVWHARTLRSHRALRVGSVWVGYEPQYSAGLSPG